MRWGEQGEGEEGSKEDTEHVLADCSILRRAWIIPSGMGSPFCGAGARSEKNLEIFSTEPPTCSQSEPSRRRAGDEQAHVLVKAREPPPARLPPTPTPTPTPTPYLTVEFDIVLGVDGGSDCLDELLSGGAGRVAGLEACSHGFLIHLQDLADHLRGKRLTRHWSCQSGREGDKQTDFR
eukprot:753765-Hanusia_phi.AAC.2